MSQVLEAPRAPLLFSEGFRVFFLSAAVFGVFAMVVWLGWLAIHAAGGALTYVPFSPPPHQWHGHEMLFGYGGAVLAGFFLTAVPNWTGAAPSRAGYIAGLAGVWFLGRAVMMVSSELPALLVMALDIVFLPLLGLNVLTSLLKRPKPKNMLFLALLAMMTAANALVHLEWAGVTSDTASRGLMAGLLTLAAMIAVLGGRITPGFTKNAMTRKGIVTGHPVTRGKLEIAGIVSAIGLAILVALDAPDAVLGAVALGAGVTNAARLAGWRTRAVLDQPILWSLHLGFAMLAAGYVALALAWFDLGMGVTAALHIVAVGAVGGMTLAVMSRAALGHTGRPLVVRRPVAAAYGVMALAALVRSVGLTLAPGHYFSVMFVSGGLWILAFVIFIAVYGPIVFAPRVEGEA